MLMGGSLLGQLANCLLAQGLGGMGVPDLERFGRALCLHWLWQEWTDDSKPWVGTEVPCKDIDRLLFNASTTITIRNGHKARFWHRAWLEGEASRYLAPNLFKLAHRKIGRSARNYTMGVGSDRCGRESQQLHKSENSSTCGLGC
jgi:hypothetical protein